MDTAKIADFVCSELNSNGFCILNQFLPNNIAKSILSEVKALDDAGIFKDGELSGGLTSSEDMEKYSEKRIRGDRITWIEGNEADVGSTRELMTHVDNLVLQCSGSNRKLGGYDIQGRTKAMVACYPGQQTGYKRHVDNPDGDGSASPLSRTVKGNKKNEQISYDCEKPRRTVRHGHGTVTARHGHGTNSFEILNHHGHGTARHVRVLPIHLEKDTGLRAAATVPRNPP
ncbi:hypothetical protein QZH41_000382 [Actinostola sp. cb2023]|nr:hypothetical protein QZH41_000382 [Actinostola sp. cb2023]